jgi:hypothetical protein
MLAEGSLDRLSQRDADIFDSVVGVDMQIAGGPHMQIKDAVSGEEGEEMIERPDAGDDIGGAGTIYGEVELDARLGGPAADGRAALRHARR